MEISQNLVNRSGNLFPGFRAAHLAHSEIIQQTPIVFQMTISMTQNKKQSVLIKLCDFSFNW